MATLTTCTLLDLVQTISDYATSDAEVVATVAFLINSGRVRLCGTFAGAKIVLPARPVRCHTVVFPVPQADTAAPLSQINSPPLAPRYLRKENKQR